LAASFYESGIKIKSPLSFDFSVKEQVDMQIGKKNSPFGFDHYKPRP
jgi:hypothetical protein